MNDIYFSFYTIVTKLWESIFILLPFAVLTWCVSHAWDIPQKAHIFFQLAGLALTYPTMYIKLLHSQTSTMIFYCYLPYVQHKKKCFWLKEIRFFFLLFCSVLYLILPSHSTFRSLPIYVYVSQCTYTQLFVPINI